MVTNTTPGRTWGSEHLPPTLVGFGDELWNSRSPTGEMPAVRDLVEELYPLWLGGHVMTKTSDGRLILRRNFGPGSIPRGEGRLDTLATLAYAHLCVIDKGDITVEPDREEREKKRYFARLCLITICAYQTFGKALQEMDPRGERYDLFSSGVPHCDTKIGRAPVPDLYLQEYLIGGKIAEVMFVAAAGSYQHASPLDNVELGLKRAALDDKFQGQRTYYDVAAMAHNVFAVGNSVSSRGSLMSVLGDLRCIAREKRNFS